MWHFCLTKIILLGCLSVSLVCLLHFSLFFFLFASHDLFVSDFQHNSLKQNKSASSKQFITGFCTLCYSGIFMQNQGKKGEKEFTTRVLFFNPCGYQKLEVRGSKNFLFYYPWTFDIILMYLFQNVWRESKSNLCIIWEMQKFKIKYSGFHSCKKSGDMDLREDHNFALLTLFQISTDLKNQKKIREKQYTCYFQSHKQEKI